MGQSARLIWVRAEVIGLDRQIGVGDLIVIGDEHRSTVAQVTSIRASSSSPSRVWKQRSAASLIRLWASGLRARSRKRSDSWRKSSGGARAMALTCALIAARAAAGNFARRWASMLTKSPNTSAGRAWLIQP